MSIETPEWIASDQDAALSQGWGIFSVDAVGPDQLQTFDEAEIFEIDADAWHFVVNDAATDPLKRKALRYLAAHSHEEFKAIVDECGGHA